MRDVSHSHFSSLSANVTTPTERVRYSNANNVRKDANVSTPTSAGLNCKLTCANIYHKKQNMKV